MRGLVLICLAAAVDKSKFRFCKDRSFCRRFEAFRKADAQQRPVFQAGARLAGDGTELKVPLVNAASGLRLELSVSGYASGAVRFTISNPTESHQRWSAPPGDVLVANLATTRVPLTVTEAQGTLRAAFAFDGHRVQVHIDNAAKVTVEVDERVVQVWNEQRLLNFEAHRDQGKLPGAAEDCSVGVDATCFGGEHRTDDAWEEMFSSHKDSKPFGPMSLGLDVTFVGAKQLFGLPEHSNKMVLDYTEPYRFFNLDVFEYELDSPMALYGAIPVVTGVHSNRSPIATSAFWNNPSDTFVWVDNGAQGRTVHFASEAGSLEWFVLPGPTPMQTTRQYTALTGPASMPPLFALGKHQCRWNYQDMEDVKTVDAKFDQYDIPYDVIWLDIEHTDGKRYFTWDKRHFGEPKKMIDDVASRGRKVVTIVDPHIKVDSNYHVAKGMPLWVQKRESAMIDDPSDVKPTDWDKPQMIDDPQYLDPPPEYNVEEDGPWKAPQIKNPEYKGEWKARRIPDPQLRTSDFEGWCWPGNSKYPDFSSPKVRDYWAEQFKLENYQGSTLDLYTWNDMNEPSVFNGPEVSMPLDALHEGNVEHRNNHNLYGLYHHRATYEGHIRRNPDARPFVLTRSFYAGSQRYGAMWTGDNFANWEHYRISVPMLLSLAISGFSFVGADVGGFFKHPQKDLISRWHQFGALAYPFYRSHAHLESPRREPWTYNDDQVMTQIRDAVKTRYSFLPLWYTLFAEHAHQGTPIVRPIWWEHLEDAEAYIGDAQNREIVVGSALLVVAADKPQQEKDVPVHLPSPSVWYDLYTNEQRSGKVMVPNLAHRVPAFVRGGSVVSRKLRQRRATKSQRRDPYTIQVYADSRGQAQGTLYVDEGDGTSYRNGAYIYQQFVFANHELRSEAQVLTHKDVASGTAQQAGVPDVGTLIERIDVIGTDANQATLVQDGASHLMTAFKRNGALTIKLPGVHVGKHNWRIVLS